MTQDKLATTLAVESLLTLDTEAPEPEILEKIAGLIAHLPPDLNDDLYREATPRRRVVDSICRKARRLHEVTDIRTPRDHALHDLVFDLRLLQQAHAGAARVEALGECDGFFVECRDRFGEARLYRDGDAPGDDMPLLTFPHYAMRTEILAARRGWRAGLRARRIRRRRRGPRGPEAPASNRPRPTPGPCAPALRRLP